MSAIPAIQYFIVGKGIGYLSLLSLNLLSSQWNFSEKKLYFGFSFPLLSEVENSTCFLEKY